MYFVMYYIYTMDTCGFCKSVYVCICKNIVLLLLYKTQNKFHRPVKLSINEFFRITDWTRSFTFSCLNFLFQLFIIVYIRGDECGEKKDGNKQHMIRTNLHIVIQHVES